MAKYQLLNGRHIFGKHVTGSDLIVAGTKANGHHKVRENTNGKGAVQVDGLGRQMATVEGSNQMVVVSPARSVVIESDEDLSMKFRNKFRALSQDDNALVIGDESNEESGEESPNSPSEKKSAEITGDDKTDDFPAAKELGYQVVKRSNKFYVFREGELLTDGGIVKKDIEQFVLQHSEGE